MKTTKILTLATCALLIIGGANAQRVGMNKGMKGMSPEERKEKKAEIEALKVTHITDKLDLTTEEAKAFWPIYNDHEKETHELRKEKKHTKVNSQTVTEEEAATQLKKSVTHKEKELTLYKDYLEKLKTAIPATKILKLQQAERSFKRELLRKLKQGKKEE